MNRTELALADSYRTAFGVTLFQQIPWSFLCLLMLDGGRTVSICAVAMLVFWVIAFVVMFRRPQAPTRRDLLVIRWAFLPIFCVTFLIAAVA